MSSTTTVRVTSAGQKVTIVQSASPAPASSGGGSDGGGSTGKGTYTYTQSQAATVWMIPHDLGRFPAVTVLDTDGNVIMADVQHLSAAVVSIGFAAPLAGKALLT